MLSLSCCLLQVPCYSYGQKLSKLAILRIACNYILSLAQLAELDYTPDHRNLSFRECVEQCTRTLQAEGRSKKRKVNSCGEDIFQFRMKGHCILKGSKETDVWFYENKMENFSLYALNFLFFYIKYKYVLVMK